MQLTARSKEGETLSISEANRGEEYLCPACNSSLGVRQGLRRVPHFYHRTLRHCHLSLKSAEHLQSQLFLQKNLPDTVTLEKSFPSIRRIADVVWETKKMILEVQCSPISLGEVKRRIHDYGKLGYQVLFLLHDKTFNRPSLSQAEQYLREQTCYFLNINRRGHGYIYDQTEILSGNRRLTRSRPILVRVNELDKPNKPRNLSPPPPPKKLLHNYTEWINRLLERIAN